MVKLEESEWSTLESRRIYQPNGTKTYGQLYISHTAGRHHRLDANAFQVHKYDESLLTGKCRPNGKQRMQWSMLTGLNRKGSRALETREHRKSHIVKYTN